MTTDTKAVTRYKWTDVGMNGWGSAETTGEFVLFTDHERVVGDLTSKIFELDRLCDATYVANGADAYNHSCNLIEQLQAERIAKGREPGTEGSLCDGLTWVYGELLESEDEIDSLRTALDASRAEVEGLRKDAERYRWIRDSKLSRHWNVTNTRAIGRGHEFSYRGSPLDTAIDTAMENKNV